MDHIDRYRAATFLLGFVYAAPSFPNSDFSYTFFSLPDRAFVNASPAINNFGEVAGSYSTFIPPNSVSFHGYIRNATAVLDTFDTPFMVTGINDSRTVVGFDAAYDGFIRNASGSTTTFSVPGFTHTYTSGINNAGDVIGYAISGAVHVGYIRSANDGSFSLLGPVSVGVPTTGYAINNSGQYTVADNLFRQAFIRDVNGGETLLTIPNVPSVEIIPTGLNDFGTVVGQYFPLINGQQGANFGFMRAIDGTITTLEAPGALPHSTTPVGINNRGQVYGFADLVDDNESWVGFIAETKPATSHAASAYALVPLDGMTYANAINNVGHVAGGSGTNPTQPSIFDGVTSSILANFGREGLANAINDSDQTVGYSRNTSTGDVEATSWNYTIPSDLDSLGGRYSYALGINNSGQIVGESATSAGFTHATLWNGATPTDLGTLGGDFSTAHAINTGGQVVGHSSVGASSHATLWNGTTPTDLGTLGGVHSTATDINDKAQIVGNSQTSSGFVHATVWNGTTPSDLGALPGGVYSVATAINNRGQIIGHGTDAGNQYNRAIIWNGTTAIDLNNKIPEALRNALTVTEAKDINDKGWIVGNTNIGKAALLIPLQDIDPRTNPGYAAKVTTIRSTDRHSPVELNRSLPTYVISHGWQPGGDYDDPDWSFSSRGTPEGSLNVVDAIVERLNGTAANIVIFEWEGAYTGGDGLHLQDNGLGIDKDNASRQARLNAEYAGVLLSSHLRDALGTEYEDDVHFIGHSYGTIVNGLAARFLGTADILHEESQIQFTILDAPTEAPFNYAPNFDKNWFRANLPLEVDYVDNYFGNLFGRDFFRAYGEPLDGAQINQEVPYAHAPTTFLNDLRGIFDSFYPSLIRGGMAATEVDEDERIIADWITPTLGTYVTRPGEDFLPVASLQRIPLTNQFIAGLGSPVVATHLPGFDNYAFQGLLLPEQSPVSALQILEIPEGSEFLSFDWMIEEGGDGDWVTAHFGDTLIWTMSIEDSFTNLLFNAVIDVSSFAGTTDALLFSLNSVGSKNARIYIGNLALSVSAAPVPIPPAIGFLALGMLSLLSRSSRLRRIRR